MEKELTLHTPINSVESSTESLDGDSSSESETSSPSSPPMASPKTSSVSTTPTGRPPDILDNSNSNDSKEKTATQEQIAHVTSESKDSAKENGGILNYDGNEDLRGV